nr:SpoIID/LytB domain-containing protein [Paenibacillus larvae]
MDSLTISGKSVPGLFSLFSHRLGSIPGNNLCLTEEIMQKTMYRKKVDRRRRKSARTDKKGIAALAAGALALLLLMLGIPGLLVDKIAPVENSTKAQPITVQEDEVVIPVYLSKTKQVEQIPMEQYVMGVVAAEMPIEFELEALKAQALAARTYITRRIAARDFSNVPVENAWVTDTVTHQAYLSQQDLKNKWKDEAVYKANMEKLQRAVNETKGEILLYNNKPIEAFFFLPAMGIRKTQKIIGIHRPPI